MDEAEQPGELLTIKAAAELTGLSPTAIRARVERGTLRSVRVGRQGHESEEARSIRIPLGELYRAKLVGVRGQLEVADLLDRLERLARRVGELEAENVELRRGR